MASVHQRGKSWRVLYRTPQGKQAQRTFKTYRDAQAYRAEVEDAANKGTLTDPAHRRLTYADWHATWMTQRPDLRDSTRGRVQGIADKHILPTFGHMQVQKITQQDVQRWVSTQTVKPASVQRHYGELSNSLRAAVDAGVLTVSPCRGIRLPKRVKVQMVILDHDEIEALADNILPRYRALVYLLAYSGLRIGEALDLTPADLDLTNGVVSVTSTLTTTATGKRAHGTPKSAAGIRTVRIPSKVVGALRQHMHDYPGEYVFTGGRGAQLHVSNFGERTFKAAVKAWNAQRETQGLKPINPRVHDLRHTAISHWIRLGVDPARVKTWAGHATAAFTLNQYAQFFPKDDQKFMDALDQNIGVT